MAYLALADSTPYDDYGNSAYLSDFDGANYLARKERKTKVGKFLQKNIKPIAVGAAVTGAAVAGGVLLAKNPEAAKKIGTFLKSSAGKIKTKVGNMQNAKLAMPAGVAASPEGQNLMGLFQRAKIESMGGQPMTESAGENERSERAAGVGGFLTSPMGLLAIGAGLFLLTKK